jgi:hypothetical protein
MVIGGNCIETMMGDALFQHGRQNPMNEEPTGKASTNEPTTDWERLRCMSDADIHAAVASDPDIIPSDKDFWGTAKMVLPLNWLKPAFPRSVIQS